MPDTTYSADISVIAWLDVKTLVKGVTWPRIPGQTSLFAEFVRWMHTEGISALQAGGGQSGPSFFHRSYSIENAVKIERWLETHGINVDYRIDTIPPDGSFQFDRDGKWVDHDPLNPMRVPPGYELLKLDEATQPGDIHWHPCWLRWLPLPGEATTARNINMPVARKT